MLAQLINVLSRGYALLFCDRQRVSYAPVASTYQPARPLQLSPRSPRATRVVTSSPSHQWLNVAIVVMVIAILGTAAFGLTRSRQTVSPCDVMIPASPVAQTQSPGEVVHSYPVQPPFSVDGEHLVLISKERRELTLFRKVQTFPVAVGKNPGDKRRVGDCRTPMTKPGQLFPIIKKQVTHPSSPFGSRYMEMSTPPWRGIAVHGTNEPGSIGHQASHGCVRLFNQDVEFLYQRLRIGDPVIITPESMPESNGQPQQSGHSK